MCSPAVYRCRRVLPWQSLSFESSTCSILHIPQFCWSSPVPQTQQSHLQVIATVPLKRNIEQSLSLYCTLYFFLMNDHSSSLIVRYQNHQKDASYITVSSSTMPNSVPSTYIVKCVSLRAAITKGQTVWIGDGSKTAGALKPGEVSKFFRHLTFRHQVRKGLAGCGQSDLECR